MKPWWIRHSSRIDALALRERILLLLSVMVCFMAAADTLWLSPAQNVQKKLALAVTRENGELEALRIQLRAGQSRSGPDPITTARQQMGESQQRLDQVNRDIVAASSLSDQGAGLPQVLVHFLRRHERLTLVRTATLAGDGAGTQALGRPTPLAGVTAIQRQGLELTVSGPYLELMNYVQTLEQVLPTLRWGTMKLNSEKMPPQLTLQVFLVGVQS